MYYSTTKIILCYLKQLHLLLAFFCLSVQFIADSVGRIKLQHGCHEQKHYPVVMNIGNIGIIAAHAKLQEQGQQEMVSILDHEQCGQLRAVPDG